MNGDKRVFRYDTTGKWFKGNTHIHTTASDGGKGMAETAALYAGAGYDFLFCTDHWISSDVSAVSNGAPLLWLDGAELNGKDRNGSDYHIVCLGRVRGLTAGMDLADAMALAREQKALLILAHPHWCGNSLEDALRWNFDGVEIYNHVCRWLNGKNCGLVYWDAMMKQNPGTLAISSDDAHLRPEHPLWNGGWIVVNCARLTREGITEAIRRGNYYSSCGPQITSLKMEGNALRAVTSPVRFVRIVGPGILGKRVAAPEGELITEASVELPCEWKYVYLEIEDAAGQRAWSNNLFVA